MHLFGRLQPGCLVTTAGQSCHQALSAFDKPWRKHRTFLRSNEAAVQPLAGRTLLALSRQGLGLGKAEERPSQPRGAGGPFWVKGTGGIPLAGGGDGTGRDSRHPEASGCQPADASRC